jgi:hypothetical protein
MNFENLNTDVSNIIDMSEKVYTDLRSLELPWKLKVLTAAYNLLMERFCPFKIGENVILIKTPKIESDSGWFKCKHFLITGATGTVRKAEVDSNGKFIFYVEFENESHIDLEGKLILSTNRHLFGFEESFLAKANQFPKCEYCE